MAGNVLAKLRSTPTRVGKTPAGKEKNLDIWVHPHACGENPQHVGRNREPGGPPPRVWGKRQMLEKSPRSYRSTPTRVGKTGDRSLPHSSGPVHPHACGENQGGPPNQLG